MQIQISVKIDNLYLHKHQTFFKVLILSGKGLFLNLN
jgi:hypothetical protein